MLAYIRKKIERFNTKRHLHEYGFKIKQFQVEPYGLIEYAQWLHPFEGEKSITAGMLRFYGQFIKNGDLVIDIGGHTGDTTVPMSVCAGKDGMVIALEPNKYVFKILEQNSRLNKKIANIVPLPFAATDEDGTFTFNYSDASFCNGGFFKKIKNQKHGHRYMLDVEGKNLEKYLHENYENQLPKLALIKVDAEGYDKEILKSLRNILKLYKPVILSECNKYLNKEERAELFGVLHELGYKLKKTDNFESTEFHAIHNADDMLLWKHFDFIAIPSK
jgi:FkbM family methyltransferase